MGTTVRGRVVVGVDDSLAGLRTLRAAVTQARMGDRELVAVRAFPMPYDREPRWTGQAAYGLYGSGGDAYGVLGRHAPHVPGLRGPGAVMHAVLNHAHLPVATVPLTLTTQGWLVTQTGGCGAR